MEFKIESRTGDRIFDRLGDILGADRVPELISKWVNEGRSCYITSQAPEESTRRIYIVLHEGERELLVAHADAEAAFSYDSRIRDLTPPALITKGFEKEATLADRRYQKRVDDLIGGNFDEELLSETCDITTSLLVAYGLAASGYGAAEFIGLSKALIEESSDPEYLGSNFLYVTCSRTNATGDYREHHDFYVSRASAELLSPCASQTVIS